MTQKIMVIDDEIISDKIVVDYLHDANYLTETVTNGKTAWELLSKQPQDYMMVIVDRMMLGVDGMELLRRIKKTPDLQNIPVIMQTGEAEPEEHVAAIAAGVFDFIYKPVDRDLLLFLVNKALNNKKAHA